MESQLYYQDPTTDQEDEKTTTLSPPSFTCATCSRERRDRRNSKRERHIPLPPSSAAKRHGYTCLPLPATSPPLSTPSPVRVSSSATRGLCKSATAPESDLFAAINLTGESPNSKIKCSATRDLYRSVSAQESDLFGVTYQTGESPNSKRLKRMKERMKEMSKWCGQVIAEDEEGEEEEEDHLLGAEVVNNHASTKQEDENEDRESEEEEEGLSVERKGEWLIIHMKCPCSKAYQFLLSGNNDNCYYKLM